MTETIEGRLFLLFFGLTGIPLLDIIMCMKKRTRIGVQEEHMSLKLSLAGDLGSGKSTVAAILQKSLDVEYYGTGMVAREIAASMGMDIAALNIYMETHPEMDLEFDRRLEMLSEDPRRLIIDSRMAWHFTKGTLKIYLTTDPQASAIRIMRAGRESEHFDTVEEAAERIRTRKESEKKRYFELYGVDCKDLTNYDLVIDTTFATPEEVAQRIFDAAERFERGESVKECYVCHRRFSYPDDAPDSQKIADLAARIEAGQTPKVEAIFHHDDFYITRGAEVALAYALCDQALVPCTLVEGTPDTSAYVKMEDTL